jgi:hypothetical protein
MNERVFVTKMHLNHYLIDIFGKDSELGWKCSFSFGNCSSHFTVFSAENRCFKPKLAMKNAVFWDVTPCGSCKKWPFPEKVS